MEKLTPRSVAKTVVNAAVSFTGAKIYTNTITDYTRFEKDDNVVQFSSGLVGWYVGHKLSPLTDAAVDKTADFIATKRAKRQAKKNHTESK